MMIVSSPQLGCFSFLMRAARVNPLYNQCHKPPVLLAQTSVQTPRVSTRQIHLHLKVSQ